MAPRDFWALSLPEINAIFGSDAHDATHRAVLARLMEAFPDA
ncbi:MAG: phage tail assembly chaperone [Pseudomonadota bacterium]